MRPLPLPLGRVLRLVRLASAALLVLGASHRVSAETAHRADDFVDAMGINIKLDRTVYQNNWNQVRARLDELGMRHYRDGLSLNLNSTYHNRYEELNASLGMKMLGLWGPWEHSYDGGLVPTNVVPRAVKAKNYLHAVEGPNEPDLFWADSWGLGGFTKRFDQARWYQNKAYDALKADNRTRNLPFVGIALAFTDNAPLLGPHKHDFIGLHIYKHNAAITSWNWEDKIQNQRERFNSTRQSYLTEFGQNTMNGSIGSSELAQMRMTTQLFATNFHFRSQFDQDWVKKSYLHQLMDESTDPNDENGNWGIVRYDGTPKPAFRAVRSMIGLLREGVWNAGANRWDAPAFNPQPLDYTLPFREFPGGGRLEQRLLQKSNGDWFLLLWLDADVWDQNARRDLGTSITETLGLPGRFDVVQHRLDNAGNYQATSLGNDVNSVRVAIPNAVTILRLRPRGGGTSATAYRLQNRWQGHAVYDGGSRARHGFGSGDAYLWGKEDTGGGWFRLRNRATGDLLHLESPQTPLRVEATTLWDSALSAQWRSEPRDAGWSGLRNRFRGKLIHMQGKRGYLEAENTPDTPGWWSAQWKLIPAAP